MEPFTDKFVYEHIIIFESICLQVKPKFRLQHDSFDKYANQNLLFFFFSRTQSIHKYLYLFIALVVGNFLWCRGNIKSLLYVMYSNVLTKKKSTDKIFFL